MSGSRKEALLFMAWRKGFSTSSGLAKYLGHSEQYISHQKCPKKIRAMYERVKVLKDAPPRSREPNSNRMSLLSKAGKRNADSDFRAILSSYGLTLTKACSMMGMANCIDHFNDAHVKALNYIIELQTSDSKSGVNDIPPALQKNERNSKTFYFSEKKRFGMWERIRILFTGKL